jgi:hypothetical protein
MNPAYVLTMARPTASNLSAAPSDASPQLRPSCTRALNRAADAPARALALVGVANWLGLPTCPPALWNILAACASGRGEYIVKS